MTAKHLADQLFEIPQDHLLMVKAGNMLLDQDKQIDKLQDRIIQLEGMLSMYEIKNLDKTDPLTEQEIRELEQKHIDIEFFDEGDDRMEYNIYGVKELIKEVERIHGIK